MTPLGLAILLFAVAAGLLVAEMLLPAHGTLGVLAALALLGGIVACYRVSHALALYVALGAALVAPFAGALWIKLWPKTPLGRRLILRPVSPGDGLAAHPVSVGQAGVVATDLRPTGLCDFNGERVECRSERGLLPAGQRVEVIAVVDGRPTVRAV
jgi:membrane-bound ClpP family serine protease